MKLLQKLLNPDQLMTKTLIFDIEATDKDNPVLIEAAWVALDSISPFTLGEEFHQRYNPRPRSP